MGDFNRGGNRGGGFRGGNDRGGRPNFAKKNFGGSDRGGRPDMHKAICSECSSSCEVPFRPSSDKPIYCNNCFSSKREGTDRKVRGDFNDRGPKKNFDRPAPRADFTRTAPANDDVKKQLIDLNTKLDRLINAIESITPSKSKESIATPVAKIKKVAVKAPIKKVETKKVAVKTPAKKVAAKKPVSKKKTK